MGEVITLVGFVLVLEGLFYAGFPGAAKRLALEVLEAPEGALRIAGLVAMIVGVAIVWLVRG